MIHTVCNQTIQKLHAFWAVGIVKGTHLVSVCLKVRVVEFFLLPHLKKLASVNGRVKMNAKVLSLNA